MTTTNNDFVVKNNLIVLGGSIAGPNGAAHVIPTGFIPNDTLCLLNLTQTIQNKTISGSSNTISNIANTSLVNSKVTLGSTDLVLGSTTISISGLTSVTSTSFVGSLTGNASTSTNGVVTTGSYGNPSWITSLSETKVLPSQGSNSGLFLTTNGTSTFWGSLSVTSFSSSSSTQKLTLNVDVGDGLAVVNANGTRTVQISPVISGSYPHVQIGGQSVDAWPLDLTVGLGSHGAGQTNIAGNNGHILFRALDGIPSGSLAGEKRGLAAVNTDLMWWDSTSWKRISQDNDSIDGSRVTGSYINSSLTLGAGAILGRAPGAGTGNVQEFTLGSGMKYSGSLIASVSSFAPMYSGKYYNNAYPSFGITNILTTANTVYYVRYVQTETRAMNNISVSFVSTNAGSVRLGLYSDNNGVPQTLLYSLTPIAVSATGLQSASFGNILIPGTYWIAINSSVATLIENFSSNASHLDGIVAYPNNSIVGQTANSFRTYTQSFAYSSGLPTTPTPLTTIDGAYAPCLLMQAS